MAAPLLEQGSTQVVLAPRADGVLCIAPGAGPHALRFNPRAVFAIAKQRSLAGDRMVMLYELLEGRAIEASGDDACAWEWEPELRTLTVHHPRLAEALIAAAPHLASREPVPC
ncbi:MAG: hypothetical protein MUE41_17515 [Gemmatimonadaceae bacterium]|nr:hypothetical protein [Gemmatimonadaceae bacterium]